MISHICQIVLGQTSELAQVLLHVHVVSDQIGSTTDRKRVHSCTCIHIYCGMLVLWMHDIEFFILSFFPFSFEERSSAYTVHLIMKRKKITFLLNYVFFIIEQNFTDNLRIQEWLIECTFAGLRWRY